MIISSKVAQYLSLISDYSAYQTMPESGCAATVYLCQHEPGVGQINVCREAFLKKCAGEEKCPIQPQHYYPPYLLGKNFLSGVFPNFHVNINKFCSILTKISFPCVSLPNLNLPFLKFVKRKCGKFHTLEGCSGQGHFSHFFQKSTQALLK